VIGSKREVRQFQNSAWEKTLRVRYLEPLEFSPRRFSCQFETDPHDLRQLQALSRRWPGLVLLLDFEQRQRRFKGIVSPRERPSHGARTV
jgi:hypothetical protein